MEDGYLLALVVNDEELIRKYTCTACRGVLTCSCDALLGTRVLSHQAMQGTDSYSAARVAVTHPLTPGVCDECRGLPPKAPLFNGTCGEAVSVDESMSPSIVGRAGANQT